MADPAVGMSVLVTGGAGFIGSHIAQRLLERGREVVVLDNMDPFYDLQIKERNLDVLRETGGDRFAFVEGSVTDEALLAETMAAHDVEFVYHEASVAGVRPSVEDPVRYEENNVVGLLKLLEAAEDAGVERLVNASSGSVNGKVEYLPYDEEHPTRPKSPYSVTKLATEHHCRVWNDLRDVNTVSLRHFTVYGPRMRPNMAITNFVSRCLNGKPPVIYGDGEQTRDFTHVQDIVDANLALLDTAAADGEVVNVGSTDRITINDLARHIVAETGADVEPVHEDAKEADARHSRADVSKAERLFGYEPSIGIREGVSDFVSWYRENRDWYEPLVLNS
jgi:UDP-glucose 4-epimerase